MRRGEIIMATLTKQGAASTARVRAIVYWASTLLLCSELLAGGVWGIFQIPRTRVMLQHLGYPAYFNVLLGIWYALGGIALLTPRFPRLKEWAYAGVTFVYSGAIASHLAVHDSLSSVVPPAVFLALTFTSWAMRPGSRRLAG